LVKPSLASIAVIAKQGVCDDQELPHDSDARDFGRFAGGAQSQILCSEGWIEADGHESGHIESVPEVGSSTLNSGLMEKKGTIKL
jgi:hypothetical protein